MSEEEFNVRFEQEDGSGEIVNKKGVELTAREAVDLLNKRLNTIKSLEDKNEALQNTVKLFSTVLVDYVKERDKIKEEYETQKFLNELLNGDCNHLRAKQRNLLEENKYLKEINKVIIEEYKKKVDKREE